MSSTLASQVKRSVTPYVPQPLRIGGRSLHSAIVTRDARRAFAGARRDGEAYLEPGLIPRLDRAHIAPPKYGYADAVLLARGRLRAAAVRRCGPAGPLRSLEVGAADAMVSWCLAEQGAQATAIDLSDRLYRDRVRASGVELLVGDATALPFKDGRFDVAFSFNSFEHLADPGAALSEMLRVVRPGGAVHLDFGPLYFSPYGLHGYRTVSIPYASLLFRRHDLEAYQRERGLRPIPFDDLNRWPVTRFRELWRSVADRAAIVRCHEIKQVAGLDLIERHPDCFATKAPTFDDLIVATIRITLRRR